MPKLFRKSPFGFVPLAVLAIVAVLAIGAFGVWKVSKNSLNEAGDNLLVNKNPSVIIPTTKNPTGAQPSVAVSPSATITPCLTCQKKTDDKTLDNDLKVVEDLDAGLNAGFSSIDNGLNDKGDSLVE